MQRYVGGLLVRNTRVLLGRRSPARRLFPNVWDVFGGHVRRNETPVIALRRELEEELGISRAVLRFVEVIEDALPSSHHRFQYWIYLVTQWAGVPENRSSEHSTIRWFTFAEARKLRLPHPDYMRLFRRYLHH